MSICTDVSLVSSLLPNEITDKIRSAERENFGADEEYMRRVARLLANLMKKTSNSLLEKQLEAFNGNAGDHQCQGRAALVLQLVQSEALMKEAKKLNTSSIELQKLIERRGKKGELTSEFFERNFEQIQVSKEMAFFLRSYLLTITLDKEYIPDINKLEKLARAHRLGNDRFQLLKFNAQRLSQETIQFLQASVPEEPMLSDAHIKKVGEKCFAPAFFEMKAILSLLKRENAVIQLMDERNSSPVYLRASEEAILPLNKVEKGTPCIRFITKDLAKVPVERFEEMILALSAKEPPYDQATSTIDELKGRAREIVEEYRKTDVPFEMITVTPGVVR